METTYSKEASDLIKRGEAEVIDVRTPGEFSEGHIATAKNIDINNPDFEDEVSKLDKGKQYVVYCLSGGRSSRAASAMRELGFTNVMNLAGGITAWKNEGLPVEK